MSYINKIQPDVEKTLGIRDTKVVIRSVIDARNNSRWFKEKKAHRKVFIQSVVGCWLILAIYAAIYLLTPEDNDFDLVFKYVWTPIFVLSILIQMVECLRTLRAEKLSLLGAIPFGIGVMIKPSVFTDFIRYNEFKETFERKNSECKRTYSNYLANGDLPYSALEEDSVQGDERDVLSQLLKQQFETKIEQEIREQKKEFDDWFISMNRGIRVDWSNLTR